MVRTSQPVAGVSVGDAQEEQAAAGSDQDDIEHGKTFNLEGPCSRANAVGNREVGSRMGIGIS
jgi:hypothetical protein